MVIPAYNYARYLPTAVNSILAQRWAPLEVIIVDDGSTDDTREVAASFRDGRVRYVWQKNAGLSAARNKGIEVAQMPFVGFLDADDAWQPDFLAEVMAQFHALSERFAAVATATGRMDEEGR